MEKSQNVGTKSAFMPNKNQQGVIIVPSLEIWRKDTPPKPKGKNTPFP